MAEIDIDSNLQDRKDMVSKKLQEREDERLKAASKRREESEKYSSKDESTAFFQKSLDDGVREIRESLASGGDKPQNELTVFFDSLSCKLATLHKFVTDSTMFLSAYDLGQSQNLLKEIQVEISLRRDELIPKKKFAFKNRKKQNAQKSAQQTENADKVKQTNQTSAHNKYDNSVNEYRIDNQSNTTVEISADEVKDKDVIMSKLSSCTIKLKGVPSAMHLTDVKSSTVICGPCARLVAYHLFIFSYDWILFEFYPTCVYCILLASGRGSGMYELICS